MPFCIATVIEVGFQLVHQMPDNDFRLVIPCGIEQRVQPFQRIFEKGTSKGIKDFLLDCGQFHRLNLHKINLGAVNSPYVMQKPLLHKQ